MLKTSLDINRYLADNPDVAAAKQDAVSHYQLHGRFEGREAYTTDGYALHPAALHLKALAKLLNIGFTSLAVSELQHWLQHHDDALRWLAGSALCQWYFRQGDYQQARQVFKQLPNTANGPGLYQHFVTRFAAEFPEDQFITAQLQITGNYAWIAQANLAAKQANATVWLEAINKPYQQAGLTCLTWASPQPSINLNSLIADKTAAIPANGPLVTVIVPMYNAACSIAMVLESLLQQRWQNIEILVIDDASTDQSAAIVAEYVAREAKVRLISSDSNAGAYHARNLGLLRAKGDFITVNDSDDWAHPDKIALQVQALLSSPSHQASISYWIRMQPEGHLLGCWQLEGPIIEKNHSSALFRRQVFTQLGFWDEVRIAADTEFLRRLTAVYGAHAILEVQPQLPLSLSLSRAEALTKQQTSHVGTIDFGVRWAYRQLSGYWLKHAVYPYMPKGTRRFSLPISMQESLQASLDILLIADYREGADLTKVLAFLDNTPLRCGILHWADPNTSLANALAVPILQRCAEGKVCIADQNSILHLKQLVFSQTAASYWADVRPKIASLQYPPMLIDGEPLQPFSLALWHSTPKTMLPNASTAETLVVANFDANYYVQRYPDIASSKTEPLQHFLHHGYQEGRLWADPLRCYQQHAACFLLILRQYQLDVPAEAFKVFIARVLSELTPQGANASTCLDAIRKAFPEQPAIKLLTAEDAYFAGDFQQSLRLTQDVLGFNTAAMLPDYQHSAAKLWVQSILACQPPSSAYQAICLYQQKLAHWPTGLILLMRHTLADLTLLTQAQQQLLAVTETPSAQSIEALLMLAQAAKQLACYELAKSLLTKRIQHVIALYPNGRPGKNTATNPSFSELARQALLDLKHCLANANTEFFLVSGTLLGCIREGKLLGHDKDIDVGIMAPVDKLQLEQIIITYPTLALLPSPTHKLFVQHKNGVLIDIFIHWQEEGKLLHEGITAGWWNTPFKLVPQHFLDETFLIPEDYDRYLTENYGDWRTPNTEFDTFLDTTNMYVTSEDELACYYLKTYADYHLQQKLQLKSRIEQKIPSLSNLPIVTP